MFGGKKPLAWGIAYSCADSQSMEDRARADRGVDSSFALRLIAEKRWPAFEEYLRKRGF